MFYLHVYITDSICSRVVIQGHTELDPGLAALLVDLETNMMYCTQLDYECQIFNACTALLRRQTNVLLSVKTVLHCGTTVHFSSRLFT